MIRVVSQADLTWIFYHLNPSGLADEAVRLSPSIFDWLAMVAILANRCWRMPGLLPEPSRIERIEGCR